MKKIKITPPILLIKEYFKNNSVLYYIYPLWLLYMFINVQYKYFVLHKSDLFILSISWILFTIVFLFVIYNPFETYYKPKKSFLTLRYFNKSFSQKSLEILKKYYPPFTLILGIIGWFIIVMNGKGEPLETALILAPTMLFLFFLPRIMGINKEIKRVEMHEDIDFVSNFDLKEISGTSDKLLIAYQNFNPTNNKKEQLSNGDYILGVSPNSLYFVFKSNENKFNNVVMNFKDVNEVGFLTFNNKSVLKFVSSSNISISVVIEHDDSLIVNSYFLIKNILGAFDNFILGDVPLNVSTRIRKIETAHIENTSAKIENKNRKIELTYSPNLLHEISQSVNISSNRKIEL